ncbi:MAG: hypothetical protein LBM23_01675 [Propionibacteriaceae bacterium]|jgi:hypothetical protein|nr:hypothetical protein [Propionibacteriaceae bacterium]
MTVPSVGDDVPVTRSEENQKPTITRSGGILVGVVSIFSALTGFIAMTLSVRVLDEADASDFLLYWSAAFFCFGLTNGFNLEMARSVTATETSSSITPRAVRARIAMGWVIVGAAVIAAAASPTLRFALPSMGSEELPSVAVALVVGISGYAGQATLLGAMVAAGAWRLYLAVLTLESTVRLILLLAAVYFRWPVEVWFFSISLAEVVWVFFLFLPGTRAVIQQLLDEGLLVYVRRGLAGLLGQGASAALVVGFPVLLSIFSDPSVIAASAGLILAISLTRAPLMVPLTAFQSIAVSYFTSRNDHPLIRAFRILAVILIIGVIGAIAAWLIGPWLFDLLAGQRLGGALLAALTFGATTLAGVTLTGVLCQSQTAYRSYLAGWVTAVLIAIMFLALPWSLEVRAVAALIGGPLAGATVHLVRLGMMSKTPKILSSEE